MTPFTAFRIHQENGRIAARFEKLSLDELGPGEVVVKVSYSSINYKDALAATGAGKILRQYPLVGGIDLAGEVVSSEDGRYKPGEKVLVTGCALSETHDGGYAQFARVKGDWVIPVPPGMTEFDVMALGTAGFTAALAIHRMEHGGQNPSMGPMVVTGATGGVGSVAIDLLAGRGYEVVAVSGKSESDDYLRALGATQIMRRQQIDFGSRPLETARWGGAIDSVGGEMLTWLTRTVTFWGHIASIGLAGGPELKTTVMPFILRGISLIGVNSSATPRPLRVKVWERIGTDLRPRHLARIVTRVIPFAELPRAFDAYLKGAVTGRTVVKIGE